MVGLSSLAGLAALATVLGLASSTSMPSGHDATELRRKLLGSTDIIGNFSNVPRKYPGGMGPTQPMPGAAQELTPAEVLAIEKYALQLLLPPAMPKVKVIDGDGDGKAKLNCENDPNCAGKKIDYYEISVSRAQQQVLPAPYGPTTVFGYGATGQEAATTNWPAFTIEARVNCPVRVKWINNLVDGDGKFIPPFLPIDQTLHWTNPPGGDTMRDESLCKGVCTLAEPLGNYTCNPANASPACQAAIANVYHGPNPTVVHLHGAETVGDESDGYSEAWFLPVASDIPTTFATVGSWYDTFKAKAKDKFGVEWTPGSATFQYPNTQRPTELWYHDHSLGMTRTNVYAGMVGLYFLRGGEESEVKECKWGHCLHPATLPGPPPTDEGVAPEDVFEIPLAIQDRRFSNDSQLFYPVNMVSSQFKLPNGPDAPFWVPEFYGNVMAVNGRAWPSQNVRRNLYRLRLLNGCDARFLILQFALSPNVSTIITPPLPFYIIGNEAGFYSEKPILATEVFMAPAERYDILVDFSNLDPGTEVFLRNFGPDGAWDGVTPIGVPPFSVADPDTTGQVMRFVVQDGDPGPSFTPPDRLRLPKLKLNTEEPTAGPRRLAQLELPAPPATPPDMSNPVAVVLGQVDPVTLGPIPQFWEGPVTEDPALNSTEFWELWSFGPDAHPIHIHERFFEVVSRTDMMTGADIPLPETYRRNLKDTVLAPAGTITRLKISFPDAPGVFQWHCHILEHEDNEMMRPWCIGQPNYKDPKDPSRLFCPGPNPPPPPPAGGLAAPMGKRRGAALIAAPESEANVLRQRGKKGGT